MDPGIGEYESLMLAVRLAAIGFACFDEIVDTAIAAHGCNVCAFAHGDAMGNPVDDERLSARVPKRAVDRIFAGVDDVEGIRRRGGFDVNIHGMRGPFAPRRIECEYVIAGLRKRGRSD